MSSAALIIADACCRFCSRVIERSIAHLFGSEANGYICFDCLYKEQRDLSELSSELTALSTVDVDAPGSPYPCPMCNRAGWEYGRLVDIDGRKSLICEGCFPRWAALNREKLGPVIQYGWKLK
jgi:hypothetical protein